MSRIAVIGAGGFIGKHLTRALAAQENDTIIAFDRFSPMTEGAESPFSELPNVELVAGNFLNRQDLSNALEGVDYVFHLVSSTNPAASSKDPLVDIDTNVRNSIELFELCVEKGVKKVIFPSSGGTVYGDINSDLISETTVPAPRSPYGIGKLTIEHYLRYFKFTSNLDYVIYRIANPYGPGQNIFGKQGVIPIFMHKFLTKEPVTIYGDGSMIRDYIYIDDLIQMMVRSYKLDNSFNEYNLGSGVGVSVNELLTNIETCAEHQAEKNYIDVPPTFVHKSVLAIDRFTNEFGPQNFTSLSDGMRKTWEYVKQLG